jgi:hypothetical protein
LAYKATPENGLPATATVVVPGAEETVVLLPPEAIVLDAAGLVLLPGIAIVVEGFELAELAEPGRHCE